jgi:hypothetical protein
MIEYKTVFSYVLPSTGNRVEYRGFTPPAYSLNVFDAIDLAVAMRLGSAAGWPTDRSALCLSSGTSKYMIQGWPGSQADNLNFVGVDGNQFYLSNRFINTGTAKPSSRDLNVRFRCVATNNWFGHVDVAWGMYLGSELKSLLATIYNDTGREYRVRVQTYWVQKDGSVATDSGNYTAYYTKDNGGNWVTLKSKSSVGGSNSASIGWTGSPLLQRNIDGTWTDLTPLPETGADVYSGTIGPFSGGAKTYYGNNSTFGGSGGGTTHLCIYSSRAT